jgi:hypothetical protein
MKFKHNQKVTCEINGTEITDARISIDKDGTPFICQNLEDGSEASDLLGYKYSWKINIDFTDEDVTNLRPTEITWETLSVGDRLGKGGYVYSIYDTSLNGKVFFTVLEGGRNAISTYSKEELQEYFSIIQPELPKEEPEEMTVAQVCKALGKEIKIIKE